MGAWGRLALAGGAVVTLFGVATFSGIFSAPPEQQAKDEERHTVEPAQPYKPWIAEESRPPAERREEPVRQAGLQSGAARRIMGGQQAEQQASVPPVVKMRPPPPMVISTYSGAPQGQTAQRQPESPTPQPDATTIPRQNAQQGAEASPVSLAGQLSGGVEMGAVKAGFLPHPGYMILATTQIPCLPTEAYNSAMGGMVSCRVPQWVRGDTQRIGLLPPGTVINGQIRGGMAQGQPRLGVLYNRIVTSGDRFAVSLKALGSDAQGRSGLDADINTFFWETTGAVALYSLIQGTTQAIPAALAAALQGGGSNNTYANFGSIGGGFGGGGQGLANRLLADRLNRQPEAERDWALPMFVTVGQDLDFYDACMQRRRVNQMACPAM